MKRVTKWHIFLIGLVFVSLAGLFVWWAFSDIKYLPISFFSKNDDLAYVPKEYYPLFVMRLLSIWMENSIDGQCKQFTEIDKSNVDAIVDILFNCGERIISSKLVYLKASYTGDDTEIKEFCLNHLEYFKEFMLNYVKCNIRTFD